LTCDGCGCHPELKPVLAWRRRRSRTSNSHVEPLWAAQFCAEGVGDERLVYPPPFWPERLDDAPAKATASAHFAPGSGDERPGR
jgi:hypothetical protein